MTSRWHGARVLEVIGVVNLNAFTSEGLSLESNFLGLKLLGEDVKYT